MPERTGEVLFAQFILDRGGRQILWMPLTEHDAQERHEERRSYAMSTRLVGGAVACLEHSTEWSPHDPEQPKNPAYVPRREFSLNIYGTWGRTRVWLREDVDDYGILSLSSIDIYNANGTDRWRAYNRFRYNEITIRGWEKGKQHYNVRSMTEADKSLC